mgnify:CR=1 FL=1
MKFIQLNFTVRSFGDEKYLTSNENTAVETIEQIQDVNLYAEDIQDNICTGMCNGVIKSPRKIPVSFVIIL